MSKIEINIDSTALGNSGCVLKLKRTVIGELIDGKPDPLGGYKTLPNSAMVYGIAVAKFVDVMYRTDGHFPTARAAAEEVFNIKKQPPKDKRAYLADPRHLIAVCYNLWTMVVEDPSDTLEVVRVPVKCPQCKGEGHDKETAPDGDTRCSKCAGHRVVEGPATELSFLLKIYEDDHIIVYLNGTIDRLGKFINGCYCIADWKTTGSWDVDDYLSSYRMSRQLRTYMLACKLEAKDNPDSVLGKIGTTKMGACIDGMFLKAKPNDTIFKRSEVFMYSDDDLHAYYQTILDYCKKLSYHIQHNYWPKEGILNGMCDQKYGKCDFWYVCAGTQQVADMLLKRDFIRKPYNPLAFND